jgi:hypothetical protein
MKSHFQFNLPSFFQKKFKAEKVLLDCAIAQMGIEEAVDELLASGVDDLDDYTRFLLSERYKSLKNNIFAQLSNAATARTASERELGRQKFQRPLEDYEQEVEKYEQKKFAKSLLRRATVNVPGFGDVRIPDLTREHIKEWQRQYELFRTRAENYWEPRRPWKELLDQFPEAKKIGDIPQWWEKIGEDHLIIARVKEVA